MEEQVTTENSETKNEVGNEMTNKKKSKAGIIVAVIVLILLLAAGAVYFFWFRNRDKKPAKDGRLVYVASVSEMNETGYLGAGSRFMGIVESQETKNINKDPSKPVKEIYVKVGDSVKEGDELFIYDTQEMELQLEQLKLDLQGINNRIASLGASITDLTNQRAHAESEDERLSLTSQINSYNASLNEEKYNLSLKQLEITKQEESIESAVVTSPMDGMIKSINDKADSATSMTQGEDGFITIMAEGDFRIKGTISEQNITSINQGTPMLIRSRVNDDIWHGTVTKIDLEPDKGQDQYYSYSMGDSASKYSFYVNPDSTDGLILGQHLYLEVDNGGSEKKEGIYVPSYYIVTNESGSFVWKQDGSSITLAPITLGEYDEANDSYFIESGLAMEDYIAYPDTYLEEGLPTTSNIEEFNEYEEKRMQEEMDDGSMPDDMGGFGEDGFGGEGLDDGSMPDEFSTEGVYDDGGIIGEDGVEFSTDYLTDEELMQDIDTGTGDTESPEGTAGAGNIDESIMPDEEGE